MDKARFCVTAELRQQPWVAVQAKVGGRQEFPADLAEVAREKLEIDAHFSLLLKLSRAFCHVYADDSLAFPFFCSRFLSRSRRFLSAWVSQPHSGAYSSARSI